jgi:hypothetical protein
MGGGVVVKHPRMKRWAYHGSPGLEMRSVAWVRSLRGKLSAALRGEMTPHVLEFSVVWAQMTVTLAKHNGGRDGGSSLLPRGGMDEPVSRVYNGRSSSLSLSLAIFRRRTR